MSELAAEAVKVDVLIFRVGRTRYGADASQIVRVDRATHQSKLIDALGTPETGTRALVFNLPKGDEAQICIDGVVGVRTLTVNDLRRVPPAAGQPGGVLGFWLDGDDSPVVLIDLPSSLDLPGGN